jgi:phosphoketolase
MPTSMSAGTRKRAISIRPLELAIRNQVDRFNLAIDVIDRVPGCRGPGAQLKEWLKSISVDYLFEQDGLVEAVR